LSSVLRPCQHSIGYMGDCFYTGKGEEGERKGVNDLIKTIGIPRHQMTGYGPDTIGIMTQ